MSTGEHGSMECRTIPARLDGVGRRVGAVVARFNHPITRRLLDGCERRLRELGCGRLDVSWVPGAVEIPLALQRAARTRRYDALVAIGVVIRGDTAHFEYVCRYVTDGVREVSLVESIPVAFCVLTVDTLEQALVRAAKPGERGSNKGAEAADVVIEMANLLHAVEVGD